MKLCFTDGCIVSGLTIDSQDYNEVKLSIEQKKDILFKLIDKMTEEDIDNEIINTIQMVGEYKYLYHCDECGDGVCEWTIKI